MQWTTLAACAFMVVQLAQGTDFVFAVLHLMFVWMWVYSFNAAGGFTRASGAYVFWFGLMTVILGTVVKAFVAEPAESRMWNGVAFMTVYTVSMGIMLLAVLISRKLTDNVVSIAGRFRSYNQDFRNASIGCSILGITLPVLFNVLPSGSGTILSVVRQIDFFNELGIILGTIAIIEESGGKRSWSLLNGIPAAFGFLVGFSTFSKQGMFTGLLCWALAVAYMRYRLGFKQVLALIATAVVLVEVLTPVAQVGRDVVPEYYTYSEGFTTAVYLISNLSETREIYKEANTGVISAIGSYYGRDMGLLARLTRIESDDPLISYSLQGHYLGYDGVRAAFLNWFPHLILPDKDKYFAGLHSGGNYYAHELGLLAAADTSTGISFGSPAESFHMGGWEGVTLLQLLIWSLLFVSIDLLCGDLRRAPWGLFFAMWFSHVAPEGGLLGTIQFVANGNFGLFVCMAFGTYGAPVLGSLLTNTVTRRAGGPASVEVGRFIPAATPAPTPGR